jgi:guanylate kinase
MNPTPPPLPPIVVVSGPAGVGKTTLVDAVLARRSLPLRRAVTATTRQPRPGEVPEVSYHFWTHDQFRAAIALKEMLEFAEVHGTDFYGTPRSEVDPYRARGVGVVLVIDVQGAGQVRAAYPDDNLSIFIAPPTFDELRLRLEGRNEPAESIRRRLHTAEQEMARKDEYDRVVINGDLTATTDKLETIIRDEFNRRGLSLCSTT